MNFSILGETCYVFNNCKKKKSGIGYFNPSRRFGFKIYYYNIRIRIRIGMFPVHNVLDTEQHFSKALDH